MRNYLAIEALVASEVLVTIAVVIMTTVTTNNVASIASICNVISHHVDITDCKSF